MKANAKCKNKEYESRFVVYIYSVKISCIYSKGHQLDTPIDLKAFFCLFDVALIDLSESVSFVKQIEKIVTVFL